MIKGLIVFLLVMSLFVGSGDVFSAEGIKIRHATSAYMDAASKTGLSFPEGIACDDQSFFVVGDTGNGRLLKYTFENAGVKGGEEIKVPELVAPIRVHLNKRGEILVLDSKQPRIARLSMEGAFKGYIVPQGIVAPDTFVPRSFALDGSDNLYILDIFGRRVIVTDPNGALIRQMILPAAKGSFSDVAVDIRGRVLLLDSVNAVLYAAPRDAQAFSPLSHSLKTAVTFPTNMTTDPVGNIYISDQNGSGIVVIGQDGSFLSRHSSYGWKDGLLRYPAQLCVNRKGEIFVADRNNSRVQIFTIIR